MEEQIKTQQVVHDAMYWIKFTATILLVVCLGLFAINQTLAYRYKAEFLQAPCKLCGELNPDVENCLKELNAPRPSYWNGTGWDDPYNKIKVNITSFKFSEEINTNNLYQNKTEYAE